MAKGMGTFTAVWAGQLVSMLGSSLTSFALGVWIYQQTGSTEQFALLTLFATAPFLVVSPFAGGWVDRHDRRRTMLCADGAAAAATLAVAVLYALGGLAVWHLYLSTAIRSAAGAFQWLAWSAATAQIVEAEDLGRANGLTQVSQSLSQLLAPVLAGSLLVPLGLGGLFALDFATFAVALAVLLAVRFGGSPIPAPNKPSTREDLIVGWQTIARQPGLVALLVFTAVSNLLVGTLSILSGPLVLAFAPAATLGLLQSVGGVGMLAGGLALGVTGGPRRKVLGVLGGMAFGGVWMAVAGLRPSALWIGAAAFGFFLSLPFIFGCTQAIWQRRIPEAVQGRVFALTGLVGGVAFPVAALIAGPLGERLFEPLLRADGTLATSLGPWLGVGPGRGLGLLFVVVGLLTVLLSAGGLLYRPLRTVEKEGGEDSPPSAALIE